MWFAPKIASAIDVLSRPELRRASGGAARFVAGMVTETVFSIAAVADHVVRHTRIFLVRLVVRPRNRLDRADPRRSCGAFAAGVAISCGRTRCSAWAALGVLARSRAGGNPLCAVSRRWSVLGGAVCGDDRVAARRPLAGRLGIGRLPEETRRRPNCSRWRCRPWRRMGGARARRVSMDVRRPGGPRAALSVRSASITATGRTPRHGPALWRLRAAAAIWCSISAPMSATAWPLSPARRAHGRRRAAACFGPRLRWLYGRDADVVIEPVAVAAGWQTTLRDQRRQSNCFDGIAGADSWPPPGAPAGRAALDKTDRRAGDTLDALIGGTARRLSSRSTSRDSRRRRSQGLTDAVKALSFEFTTIQRDVALACIERCAGLGYAPLQCRSRRKPDFEHGIGSMARTSPAGWAMPHAANSGDIYALAS